MPDNTEPSAIELAREAAAQFVEEMQGRGAVMTTAVLLYEVSYLNDDSEIEYKVQYSSLTDSSMSSVAGTIMLGHEVFMQACTQDDDED